MDGCPDSLTGIASGSRQIVDCRIWALVPLLWLQALAARVAGVDIVPELDIVLIEFPAEKHLAAITDVGKIDKAAFEILDLHAHVLETTKLNVELEHVHEQTGNFLAANIGARLLQLLAEFRVGLLDDIAAAVRILKNAAEFGKQRPRFLEREMFLKMPGHGADASGFLCVVFQKSLERSVPRQGRAFHAHGEFQYAFEGLQIAQFLAPERHVAAHHLQETINELPGLG